MGTGLAPVRQVLLVLFVKIGSTAAGFDWRSPTRTDRQMRELRGLRWPERVPDPLVYGSRGMYRWDNPQS